MSETQTLNPESGQGDRIELESAVVRFAGDSGDGIQLTGGQFTVASALAGNDLTTFPDFPAEIRAPVGTTYGVSAFQINFGGRRINTSGDAADCLVAFNPAALKTNIDKVNRGGLVIVDSGNFGPRDLKKAGYEVNPLEDGSLEGWNVVPIDISRLTLEAVADSGLGKVDALRCKNFWALGLIYWVFGRDRAPTAEWIEQKFGRKDAAIAKANVDALNAGHAFGETMELLQDFHGYRVPKAELPPGLYRTITGGDGFALGLAAAAQLTETEVVFASYPITPASPILHHLVKLTAYGVTTHQAEDEIAAACVAIGASYGGAIGVTSSSGPGIALKGEAIGLAVAAELPLVIINTQRAGPSTGLPTKTEQSDLYQALYGRNGDTPLVVLAPNSPADCFTMAIEATRIATKYMVPVMVLSDGYIANASEPWLIPDVDSLPRIPVTFRQDPEGYLPFKRDPDTLARDWAKPGTPGLAHRVGGIERDSETGDISYDPANHQRMTDFRHAKVAGVARDIPPQTVDQGKERGRLAVVGWGSTYGPIKRAVTNLRAEGLDVSHIHLRHIWPLPENLGALLDGFDQVLVPEMNTGQLLTLLRATYAKPYEGLSKVTGQPFKIAEIEAAVRSRLEG
ncbi:2-oxoglutarate oxidoreductase, alpha subunit [Caenispirillum salinarum AK4]|uniref:2-oxoglutarate oxidoreductase, alpha subunit n=1 Tax=Caenispirillum salinarum AK4 TaxID=1238182 RepID=K9HCH1_9PROT|nr:2-oxoacid:acceptor oxidoreductase subunit alpha [Caenispirillum salinarum]EKV28233.1 2-oxoglutarate oxidoreductase, alpha subunit [Caenispirillum salinarum AK4]